MTLRQARHLVALLTVRGVRFEEGLTESELAQIAHQFGIVFPPDLRLFLHVALPTSPEFAPWRQALTSAAGAEALRKALSWPLDNLLFDAKCNTFWYPEWGAPPDDEDGKEQLIRQYYPHYPTLIPLYSHRFLPALPLLAGNPVFSMYGTDIIHYGNNLASYFAHEFGFKLSSAFDNPPHPNNHIVFWDALVKSWRS
jgi:hypothetical protein